MSNSRALAADILRKVIKQQISLDNLLEKIPEQKDSGFIKELCFGTLRWCHRLNPIAEALLNKPLPAKHFDVHCLLLIGLYQLIYLKTPAHAAVSESVNAVVALKKLWAKALINKTLRLFISHEVDFLKAADTIEEGHYSHPQWLIGKIKKAYPERFFAIFNANNLRAPLTLRVNSQKISRDAFLALLAENNIGASFSALVPSAVQLDHSVPVAQIPGFFEGLCSVQDLAGQLAAFILDPKPGQRILDACAAPGSKAMHLLEKQPLLEKLVALDSSADRLDMLRENLLRLQLDESKIEIRVADASQEISDDLFDAILLDAPCSGTGVIRRHPDIKVLRHPEDVVQQTKLQAELLEILWGKLKPGASLLYSTCSILPEENEKQIIRFLSQHPEAKSVPLSFSLGAQLTHGLQILPGEQEADGFYYCLLRRVD